MFWCRIYMLWGYSSVGRAVASHVTGQRFESAYLHHERTLFCLLTKEGSFNDTRTCRNRWYIFNTISHFHAMRYACGIWRNGCYIIRLSAYHIAIYLKTAAFYNAQGRKRVLSENKLPDLSFEFAVAIVNFTYSATARGNSQWSAEQQQDVPEAARPETFLLYLPEYNKMRRICFVLPVRKSVPCRRCLFYPRLRNISSAFIIPTTACGTNHFYHLKKNPVLSYAHKLPYVKNSAPKRHFVIFLCWQNTPKNDTIPYIILYA